MATDSHFPCLTVTPQHSFKPCFSALTRNVAWSFFCLDDDPQYKLKNDFVQDLYLKPDYTFPKAKYESHHMDIFYKALIFHLQGKAVHVEKIGNPGNTEHLCQFSGGGDLFVCKKKLSMVVINDQNEHPSTKPPSPVHENEHLSGLTMEAKKSESTSNLECQLFANMLIKSVDTFKTRCKGYDESVLRKVDTVLGYGAVYTGFGEVGLYKLKLKFGSPLNIECKHEIKQYSQPSAAAFIDEVVDYFLTISKDQDD